MVTKNPYADYMKAFSDYKTPNFDINQVLSFGRRNAEAFSAASSVIAESAQAVSRHQAESVRSNVEQLLKTAKEMMVNGSPEINTTKQAELAKSMFEASLNSLRSVSEIVTKSSFQAFDVINKRAAESLEEISAFASKAAA